METNRSKNWVLYLGTLLIELITGLFRLLLTIPLTMVLFLIVGWLLSKIGIGPVDVFQLNTDPQYAQGIVVLIVIVAAILAYANIIASLVAYFGFGGGSLMTRFVLGAREASTRERETILQVFEQMADGADFPIRSYSKLYVIDSVLEFANLVGTTLYVTSAGMRGDNLQALIAHEFGHLNNGDGSLILALRRLVFPPFSLFIGGIRDFSTNRPAYRPAIKEFDAVQIFYSIINNIIFFTLAFIGGGIGVWVMSWAWAGYFRTRDYVADSFAAGLGYRDLLVSYLEANIFFDTSIPYMLGWRPAAELRIDALQHPGSYGLPAYGDVPAAAAAAAFTSLADVQPATERMDTATATDGQSSVSSKTARNFFAVVIIVIFGYLLFRSWPNIQERASGMIAEAEKVLAMPTATVVAGQVGSEGGSEAVEATTLSTGPYDCLATVSASRDLEQYGSGNSCWLQLVDGATAVIDFHDEAQITYRTTSSGDDIYFYVASPGDRLTDVVGAMIRPIPFVQATYGGLEEVKNSEIRYHSPGGQWVACLRDVNNAYLGLNELCSDAASSPGESVADAVCPGSETAAAALFGGNASHWRRLGTNAWKYGPSPAAPIEDLNIPAQMKGDWWDNYQAYAQVGPANVGYASEATIWCVPAGGSAGDSETVEENGTGNASSSGGGRGCIATQLGPLVQGDHYFQAPVFVIQLWRMNGDSPWGDDEVMTVVENEVSIRGAGGNAWAYPAADCLNVATIEMQGGANTRGSTVVTPEELRAAGMID